MRSTPRKGLTSLFREVKVFKVTRPRPCFLPTLWAKDCLKLGKKCIYRPPPSNTTSFCLSQVREQLQVVCQSLCSEFLFPLQPPPPTIPTNPPAVPPQRAWFRSVSGPFGCLGPFWVCFGSVSGPFRVRFGVLGGVGMGSGKGGSVRERLSLVKVVFTIAWHWHASSFACPHPTPTLPHSLPIFPNFPQANHTQPTQDKNLWTLIGTRTPWQKRPRVKQVLPLYFCSNNARGRRSASKTATAIQIKLLRIKKRQR